MNGDLIELVQNLGQPRVLVVGDVMLDRYIWGDAARISQEAPVMLLQADRREERLGGASSVATMLRALGARVSLAGVVGADRDGEHIRRMMTDLGIDHEAVISDASRPSTVKERYIGRAQSRHPQQIVRVDYETRTPLDDTIQREMSGILLEKMEKADIVLVSDYDKGVCTPALMRQLIDAAKRKEIRVVADPIRGSDYRKYHGCSAITPNRLEAGLATNRLLRTMDEAMEAAGQLREQLDLEAGIVTLDKEGMVMVHADGRRRHFQTRPRQVYDITGAGDMVMATLAVTLAAGAEYEQAIQLANIAGGLEVEKVGVVTVTRDEILRDLFASGPVFNGGHGAGLEKLFDRQTLLHEIDCRRKLGQRIAFTNGCFDVIHAGHVQYLREARAQADLLVVGLNSDASVRSLKGVDRPVNEATARAAVLNALSAVDYVSLFEEATPLDLIRCVRPDVLVKGADYHRDEVVGADYVESYGGAFIWRRYGMGFRQRRYSNSWGRRDSLVPTLCVGTQLATLCVASGYYRDAERPEVRSHAERGNERLGMNLAVFLPNWIGDVVMATPALRALRQHFHDARIIGILKPYVAGLLAGSNWLDELVLTGKESRPLFAPSVGWGLRSKKIDLAVFFTNSFRTAFIARVAACKRRVGYAMHGRSWLLSDALPAIRDAKGRLVPSPVLDAYNRLVEHVGCPSPGYRMELFTTPQDEILAEVVWDRERLHRFSEVICLNPGAAFGAAKHWPAEHFARLANDLARQRGSGILVLCGPNERELCRDIVAGANHPNVRGLAEYPLSLGLTKACVRRASLLVTTDSGPRHFAAAFERPVVTLFGPTHIAWTDTYFPREIHLQEKLDCGPCQQRVCPLGHHRCMKELVPEKVNAAVVRLLANSPPEQRERRSSA